MFNVFLGSMSTLVVCVFIGFVGRKLGFLSDNANDAMATLLVKFTLPATVFASITMRSFSRELLLESLITLGIMTIIYFLGYSAASIFAKLVKATQAEKRIWQFSLMFPNVVYIGFPIVQSVFGDNVMIHASMSAMAFNILVFTFGAYLIKSSVENEQPKAASTKQILLSPALVAMYIGIIFFVMNLPIPAPLQNAISMFAAVTTPLAMLLMGSLLSKYISAFGIAKLFADWRIYPLVILRLVAIPLVAYFIIRNFITDPIQLGAIITLGAMPVATITIIFTEQHKADTGIALKLTVASDLLCLATVPLISLLFEKS
ncbi:MAG: AEC family transporter [Defluviitaleaceae bacterium]|nr:AEC family transporter [Defluviitaleaceae bacterium]